MSAVHIAVNLLLTGDPATTPGLAKVLLVVGLPCDKRVLHAQHPLHLRPFQLTIL
jgi:hypothetical protein